MSSQGVGVAAGFESSALIIVFANIGKGSRTLLKYIYIVNKKISSWPIALFCMQNIWGGCLS